MVILLVTLFAISFFVTLNYRDISNKRYIRKRLKNLKVGESIPTEYHLYADYLITKGKVGLEFTSKVGDVKTEISRIK